MIDETMVGPGTSEVLGKVVGNFTGSVASDGTHEVQLQRRRKGTTRWGVVRVLRDTDEETEFRGFERGQPGRDMEYRYEVIAGTNVALWLV